LLKKKKKDSSFEECQAHQKRLEKWLLVPIEA